MLPPEEAITLIDRLFCLGQGVRSKYRLNEEFAVFIAHNDRVIFRSGDGLGASYWSYSRDEAGLIAELLLALVYELEPDRVVENSADKVAAFNFSSLEKEPSFTDGFLSGFGVPVARRLRISDAKDLLVGEFGNGRRFKIVASSGWKPGEGPSVTTFTLSMKDAELVGRTMAALVGARAPGSIT